MDLTSPLLTALALAWACVIVWVLASVADRWAARHIQALTEPVLPAQPEPLLPAEHAPGAPVPAVLVWCRCGSVSFVPATARLISTDDGRWWVNVKAPCCNRLIRNRIDLTEAQQMLTNGAIPDDTAGTRLAGDVEAWLAARTKP